MALCIGPADRSMYRAGRKAARGRHCGADRPGIDLFRSISPELLFEKMSTVSPYVEKFAMWEYQTHLDPDSEAPGAKELNSAYREWLKQKGETTK
ncbi:MAG: hypothetical protein ABFS28_09560 [Bacteroidota bacterium]